MFKHAILATLTIAITLTATMPTMAGVRVVNAPSNSEFKSYMDYRAIKDKSSTQYELQQDATTDSLGIRMIDNRFLVAIGTGYGASVGDDIDITLETGVVVPCTVGEVKADKDTYASNLQSNTGNGNVVEFIVDTHKLQTYVKRRGTLSVIPGLEGDVESIGVLQDM